MVVVAGFRHRAMTPALCIAGLSFPWYDRDHDHNTILLIDDRRCSETALLGSVAYQSDATNPTVTFKEEIRRHLEASNVRLRSTPRPPPLLEASRRV